MVVVAQGGCAKAVAQSKRATRMGGPLVCKALAMTYFLTGNPQYHRRDVVSRSCSGWEGVGPTRYGRQEFCVVLAALAARTRWFGKVKVWVVLPRRLKARTGVWLLQSYRVKPHGQLVLVSSRRYRPCTPSLSTSWSRTTLQGG